MQARAHDKTAPVCTLFPIACLGPLRRNTSDTVRIVLQTIDYDSSVNNRAIPLVLTNTRPHLHPRPCAQWGQTYVHEREHIRVHIGTNSIAVHYAEALDHLSPLI